MLAALLYTDTPLKTKTKEEKSKTATVARIAIVVLDIPCIVCVSFGLSRKFY